MKCASVQGQSFTLTEQLIHSGTQVSIAVTPAC